MYRKIVFSIFPKASPMLSIEEVPGSLFSFWFLVLGFFFFFGFLFGFLDSILVSIERGFPPHT